MTQSDDKKEQRQIELVTTKLLNMSGWDLKVIYIRRTNVLSDV